MTTKKPDNTARFEEAVQQYNRAARLETLAKTEAARATGNATVLLQLRVLTRATAAAREASRCARQAHESGVDAEVVHLAATTALGCADAAQDALEVLRQLLKAIDPAFTPSAPPPERSSTAPDRFGPMTRELVGRIEAAQSKECRYHDTTEDVLTPSHPAQQ